MTTTPHQTITIRPTTLADIPFVLSAERHPSNARYIGQWSEDQHITALERPRTTDTSRPQNQNNAHLIASVQGKPIGYCILQGLCDPHSTLNLKRIVIVEKGLGYGRQLLRWVKQHTFVTLHYHRLWLDVAAKNYPAKALYFSEGFVQEGRLREAHKTTAGDYADMLILSMLAREFLAGESAQGPRC